MPLLLCVPVEAFQSAHQQTVTGTVNFGTRYMLGGGEYY